MKDKLIKRRIHVNWNQVRIDFCDSLVDQYYWVLKSRLKRFSDNRLSYLAFLHCFDKKILDYYRLTKDLSIFVRFRLRNDVKLSDLLFEVDC